VTAADLPILAVYGGPLEAGGVQTQCELRNLPAAISAPELHAAVADAAVLVVLDPLRFPFDSLREADWEIPVVASLPQDRPAATLLETLNEPLLSHLTFFDRVATEDDALWRLLRERLGWGEWQRIDLSDHAEIVRAVAIFHSLDARGQRDQVESAPDPVSDRRGRRFANELPHRMAEGARRTLRESKAVHLSQTRALRPVLGAAHELIGREGRLRMLEVGAGVGQRTSLVRARETEFTGLDPNSACVRVARHNFPESEFRHAADLSELPLPDERFDLVLSVTALQRTPHPLRQPLVSEIWRVLRRGGWLVLLEEVVQGGAGGPPSPLRAENLETLIVEGSGGGAVLEHFEAVRYPQDDVHRAALVVCSKVSGLEDPVRLHGLRRPAGWSPARLPAVLE
jgi:SAM-dependent methyltransferase